MADFLDDDTLDTTDDTDTPGVDLSSLSARSPRSRLGALTIAGAPDSSTPDFKAMLDRSYRGIADRYAKAEELINQQYRGAGRNELLLTLGAALLAPTRGGSFKESLANIPAALLGYLHNNQQLSRDRAAKLAQLEIQRSAASELAPKDIYALQAKYAPRTQLIAGQSGIYAGTLQPGHAPVLEKLAEGPPKPPKYMKGPTGDIVQLNEDGTARVVPVEGTGGGPGGLDIDPNLTGPAFEEALKQKDPVSARAARALIEGRGPPVTAYSSRNPKLAKLIELAQQIDPTFDVTTAAARRKTRMDYSPGGKEGQKFISANTVIGHLGSLAKSVEALDNSDYPWWNAIANPAAVAAGDKKTQAALSRANQDIHAVASELRRLFVQTGGGTLQELNAWESTIGNSSSPEQFKAAINEAVRLAKSRIDPSVDAYNATMGTSVPYTHFISKGAQRTLQQIAPDYFAEDPSPDTNPLTAEGARAELDRRHRTAAPAASPASRIKVISVTPIGR